MASKDYSDYSALAVLGLAPCAQDGPCYQMIISSAKGLGRGPILARHDVRLYIESMAGAF